MHRDFTRTWLATAGILSLLLASAEVLADVELYADDNYQGRSITLSRDQVNLAAEGFNDSVSSVVVRGGSWDLCADADFNGKCVTLAPGRYPSLRDLGVNDTISSVGRADSGRRDAGNDRDHRRRGRDKDDGTLVLYKDDNYSGDSRTFSEDDANLQRSGFNDASSSAVIDGGRWELCGDAGFQGKCVVLGRGRYASLRDVGLNDSVSSVRRASSRSGRDDSDRGDRE